MAEPPELWTFVASNVLILATGGTMTILSLRAYLRSRNTSFGTAMAGFGLITVGGIIDIIYELGIRNSYELPGRELLALHTVQGVVIAAGLATLFVSLRQH